jgi:hypothetical protein
MNLWNIGLSLLPLLIPVIAWAMLHQRKAAERRAESVVNRVDLLSNRVPRVRVGEFSSGGAIASGVRSKLVRDVLLGEHECVLFRSSKRFF